MKTRRSFSEVTVVNIDKQIDGQVKRHKAIKPKSPQDQVRRERIRDTIERMRDRRNKLTGKPKSEPVESVQHEMKIPGIAGIAMKMLRGYDPKDIQSKVSKLSPQQLKAVISASGVSRPGDAQRKLTSKDYTMWKAAYDRLQKEAKSVDGTFDLDDTVPVKFPSLGDKFSTKNAKKRKRADVEHESVQHESYETLDEMSLNRMDHKDLHNSLIKHFGHVEKGSKISDKAMNKYKHYVKKLSKSTGHSIDKIRSHIRAGTPLPENYEADGVEDLNEVLNVTQRRKRAMSARRNKSKLKMGRKRQLKKLADKDRLKKRAKAQARRDMVKRLTKGVAKGDLTPQRRAEIERRLEKMKGRLANNTRKILPSVRKTDINRRSGK